MIGLPAPILNAPPSLGPGVQGPVGVAPTTIGTGIGLGAGIGIRPAVPMFMSAMAPPVGLAGFPHTEMMIEVAGPMLLNAIAHRRGQPQGPTNDREVEEFLYDVLDVLPGAQDVEVRCEGGRLMLTGSVQHKKLKRDVGELGWALPVVDDVQNNVTIAPRRRTRGGTGERQASTGQKG